MDNNLRLLIDIVKGESKFKYNNTLIIGKNGVGKSRLIYKSLMKLIENNSDDIYFIGVTNRTMSNPSSNFEHKNYLPSEWKEDILKNRLDKNIYNKQDSLYKQENKDVITNELIVNLKKYKKYIDACLNIKFDVLEVEASKSLINNEEDSIKFTINDESIELSNGYQSIIRLLVESLYAIRSGARFIFVDEIATSVDASKVRSLINFLQNDFVELLKKEFDDDMLNITWIWTTHNPYVIVSASSFNILYLEKSDYKILNSNNFKDMTDIIRSFSYFQETSMEEIKQNISIDDFLDKVEDKVFNEEKILKSEWRFIENIKDVDDIQQDQINNIKEYLNNNNYFDFGGDMDEN